MLRVVVSNNEVNIVNKSIVDDDLSLARYSRQMLVPGMDLEGQERLAKASVLIVGCGGLGCPAALYLAAAGVGRLCLVDDDRVELSNLPRQIAFDEADVGALKVTQLADQLRRRNSQITVEAFAQRFDAKTAVKLLAGIDIVLDASDSQLTRRAIDAFTYKQSIPWVMGTAVQMSGMWLPFSGGREEGCYHCLAPSIVEQQQGGCENLGILGPVVGSVALSQAFTIMSIITDCAPVRWGQMHLSDMRNGDQQHILLDRRSNCECCSKPATEA